MLSFWLNFMKFLRKRYLAKTANILILRGLKSWWAKKISKGPPIQATRNGRDEITMRNALTRPESLGAGSGTSEKIPLYSVPMVKQALALNRVKTSVTHGL